MGRKQRPLPVRIRPHAAIASLLILALALVILTGPDPAAAAADPTITWPRDLYNPKPRPDDVLLPLPCGGAMALRWVQADGQVPADIAGELRTLFRLNGPFARDGRRYLLVGKYEVTALQYQALQSGDAGVCPEATSAGRLVQGQVGWHDALSAAARWSQWLAAHAEQFPDCATGAPLCLPRQHGKALLARLPTEAEWEYAARGGLAVSPMQFAEPLYPMDGGLAAHIWYAGNTEGQRKPIGYRAPNPLGLHDLYGNVEELMLGLYRSELFPGQVGAAVIRGGSIHTKRDDLGATRRSEVPFYGLGGANRAPDNGFRLIVDLIDAAPDGAELTQTAALPPPTRAAEAVGHLQVNVDIPAQVSIDGQAMGQAAPGAPVEVAGLSAGEHRVEIEAEGYATVGQSHPVSAERWTQLAVVMEPQSALQAWQIWAIALVTIALFGTFPALDAHTRRRAKSAAAGITASAIEPSVVANKAGPTEKIAMQAPTLIRPKHAFEPEMIALPGGVFWMGSKENEANRSSNEGPRHQVRMESFVIGKTAVTFAQYDAFAEAAGREEPDDEGCGRGIRPVINVSWHDAIAYAEWLSEQAGAAYRLPTEAEWEYAARAGTETPFWTGHCIHTDQANYDGNYDYDGCGARTGVYRGKTVPAGSLPPNPSGLHEVHGNVLEWVQDCWHGSYDGAPTNGNAWEKAEVGECGGRVVRGGSWYDLPKHLRSATRYRYRPGSRSDNLGFRLARDL